MSALINSSVLKERLQEIINSETRSSLEIGAKKRPKIEILKSIQDEIKILFILLYSVGDILSFLNKLSSKFSVSDTTFHTFVKEFLPDEYIFNQKMRYFVYKKSSIKQLVGILGKESLESIFKELNPSGKINKDRTLELTFEDFTQFMENYYFKATANFIEASGSFEISSVLEKYGKSGLENSDLRAEFITKDTVVSADQKTEKEAVAVVVNDKNNKVLNSSPILTIDDFKAKCKFMKKDKDIDLNCIAVWSDEDTVNDMFARDEMAAKNRLIIEKPLKDIQNNFGWKRFEGSSDFMFANTNKFISSQGLGWDDKDYGSKRVELRKDLVLDMENLDKIDFSKIPEQIKVNHNKIDFIKNVTSNMYAAHMEVAKNKILERYFRVENIDFLQIMDLSTLELVEGQIIVTPRDTRFGRKNDLGLDVYRYFRGEVWFVLEGYYAESNPHIATEEIRNWEFLYSEELREVLRRIKGEKHVEEIYTR